MVEARQGHVHAGHARRNALNNPEAFNWFHSAVGELSSALSRPMVTVERTPDLKANTGLPRSACS